MSHHHVRRPIVVLLVRCVFSYVRALLPLMLLTALNPASFPLPFFWPSRPEVRGQAPLGQHPFQRHLLDAIARVARVCCLTSCVCAAICRRPAVVLIASYVWWVCVCACVSFRQGPLRQPALGNHPLQLLLPIAIVCLVRVCCLI